MDRSRIDTVETTRAPGDDAVVGDVRDLPSRTSPSTAMSRSGCCTTWTTATGRSGSWRASFGPAAASWRPGTGARHLAELWALIGFEYPGSPFGRENGRAGDTAVFVADR